VAVGAGVDGSDGVAVATWSGVAVYSSPGSKVPPQAVNKIRVDARNEMNRMDKL